MAPRLLFWISDCWNPLSRSQSIRVRKLLEEVITYREHPYTDDIKGLIGKLAERLESTATQSCMMKELGEAEVPPEELTSRLWTAAKLARISATFSGLLSDHAVRHIIWDVICMQCLKPWFTQASSHGRGVSPSAAAAFIIISASPPMCSYERPPVEVADFLRHIEPSSKSCSCLMSEYKKLCL